MLRFLRRFPAPTFSCVFRGSPAGRSRVVNKAILLNKCTIVKNPPFQTLSTIYKLKPIKNPKERSINKKCSPEEAAFFNSITRRKLLIF